MSATPTPLNRLRQQWRDKKPTFGAIATIPSVQTVRIMASSLDWISPTLIPCLCTSASDGMFGRWRFASMYAFTSRKGWSGYPG